ncbi:MAG: NAD(P)/FAD-dependent oxidoreductase [Chloroflexi bacterium]|nr:MAG: NAD(P)/FAD-dependent oxidoreductase [Chloroflexota bacterium]
MTERSRVVIVGAGFAGLTAARALKRAHVSVLLLDRVNFHTFTPLLYQVASALLDPSEIAHPVREIVRPLRNVEARLAEVTAVDLHGRAVETSAGRVAFNYLVLAAGSVNNFYGIEGMAEASFGLKHLDQALSLRNRILEQFEKAAWAKDPRRRRALLTFAVVGGGPTGVEFTGAVQELIRNVLQKDFPELDVAEARVVLVEAADHLLGAFDPKLREDALRRLERKGAEVLLRKEVKRVVRGRLELGDGEKIEAGTVIWTAGVKANDLARSLGLEAGKAATVRVEPTLQLPGHPEAFAIGDMAYLEQGGQALPMLIPVAMQQARHVARAIDGMTRGRAPRPFHYADPGMMATIGRNAGIAQLGPVRIDGFPGWLLWLGFHLLQIITLRAKLVVLVNWTWDYFFLDRPIRLLVRASR